MKILAAFGDKRYAYMAAFAREQGIDAFTFGLELANVSGAIPIDPRDLPQVDCVVMPNPFAKGLAQPFAEQKWEIRDFLKQLAQGTILLMFGTEKLPQDIADEFVVVDIGADEHLMQDNAILTAEGAVVLAMQRSESSIRNMNCLIIGYGRIGRSLNELLIGLDARPTIAARREEVRRRAIQRGADVVDMEQMEEILPYQQIIFSTPPEMVLGEEQLKKVSPDALIIDLSSAPYGVDFEAAKRLGINAWLEPGLPGRFSPKSAGYALLKTVETIVQCGGV